MTGSKRDGIFNVIERNEMEELNLEQLTMMIPAIAEDKGLPEEKIIEVIESAIAAAWRKDYGTKDMEVRAEINIKSGDADVYVQRVVVEDGVGYNPDTEIPEAEAGGKKIDEIVEEKFPKVKNFGRVASQTAKQVLVQRLREAERDAVLVAYEDKIGTVVNGTVARVEPRLVKVDLGKVEGILPRSEQIDGERYVVGRRIRVFIKGVESNESRAQLVLSRGNAEFIEYLFRQEVPEIETGAVEIKGVAREAGRRTKIAVNATVPGVDAVGTFVGGRGVRVQAVMAEIGDRERIDIVNWSDNPSEYIRDALSPAEVQRVEIEGKRAKVFLAADQQPIAVGKGGQNVRLASKLTGYELDIEVAQAQPKKKKKNVEDDLLSAIADSGEEQ
jgi:N utilization substance protein A